MNDDPNPQGEAPVTTPPASPDQKSGLHQNNGTVITSSKKTWYLRWWFWLATVVTLVGLGAGAWALIGQQPQVQQTSDSGLKKVPVSQTPGEPTRVVYTHLDSINTPNDPSCGASTTGAVYTRPLSGGDKTQVFKLPDNVSVSQFDTHGSVIALITDPSCGTDELPKLYASTDGGTSFKELAKTAKKGDSFTSVVVSDDGASVYAAMLNGTANRSNTVSRYSLDDPDNSKVVFTSDKSGVFLYAVVDGVVYYMLGCFQCDGSKDPDLLTYSQKTSVTKTVATVPNLPGRVVFADDSAKALITSLSTGGEVIGGSLPADFYELTVASGALNKLFTETTNYPSDTGYRTDGFAYYVAKNQILGLSNPGKLGNPFFESSKDMLGVHYLSSKLGVYTAGTYDDFKLEAYSFATTSTSKPKTTTILSGDQNTRIISVQ